MDVILLGVEIIPSRFTRNAIEITYSKGTALHGIMRFAKYLKSK
jgi:hypothetical protein